MRRGPSAGFGNFCIPTYPPRLVIQLLNVLGASLILLSGCSESTITPLPSPSPAFLEPPVHIERFAPLAGPYFLAILPFNDYANRSNLQWLQQGLPDMLTTDLAVVPGVRIVSRQRLGAILREQFLQHRGTFQERPTARIGRLTGARYLLTGMFYVVDVELIVEAHLLDVEQGQVVRTVRVRGDIKNVPALERDLVKRLSQLFQAGTPLPQNMSVEQAPFRMDSSPLDIEGPTPSHRMEHDIPSPDNSSQHTIPKFTLTDIRLNLERLQTGRQEAAQIANRIWTHGIKTQVGEPEYQSEASGLSQSSQTLQVWIPISVAVDPERLTHVSPDFQLIKEVAQGEYHTAVMAFRSPDQGAQVIFLESIQTARRLFVRAIRRTGEVIALSSHWSWRVEQHIDVKDNGVITFPIAPTLLLTGKTPFAGSMFLGPEAPMTFDWVIVPVPHEQRTVTVEHIEDSTKDKKATRDYSKMIQFLTAWLQDRWAPPITESIFFPGYLPGNHRTGIVRLETRKNTVERIHILQLPMEAGVADSIRQLLEDLPGQCFESCQENSTESSSQDDPIAFRVQFDLMKDITHAGLHEKVPEAQTD